MGRELVTGLIFQDGGLEWTTVAKDRSGIQVAAHRKTEPVQTPPSDKEEPGESAAGKPDPLLDLVRKESGSFKGRLSVGLPSDQLLIRVVTLPSVAREEVAGMVELQFDKISPFPVDQMVFSHEVISQTDTSSVVLIVGAKSEIVDAVEKTLNQADVLPARVDAGVLAWWRSIEAAGEIPEKGRQVILIKGKTGIDAMVVQDRIPVAFRFLGKAADLSDDAFEDEAIDEIGYTLMSLELEHGRPETMSFAVWHEDDLPGGLAEKLKRAHGCPVSVKPLRSLPPLSEGVARREAASTAEPRLDLTPAAWRQAGHARLFKRKMLIAAEILVGVWILCALGLVGGSYIQGRQLQHLRAQAAKWRVPAQEVSDMQKRVRTIVRYMDRTCSAIECFREVCALQPLGVDLTSFNFKKGENVKVSGEAQTVEQVYDFKTKVDNSRLFTGSTLTGPRYDSGRARHIFEIDMKLPGGES